MINEILLTAKVVLASIGSVFLIGWVFSKIALIIFKIDAESEKIWLASPLVGVGAIILICQNLLYLGVPVKYSALLMWSGTFFGGTYILLKGVHKPLGIPMMALVSGIIIYLIHALGLIILGPSNYYGHGWGDMYNYVSTAQFFVDYPFSSTIDSHEFMRTANYYKEDRIGQSVLHAFVTATAGADAQQTFGAVSIMSPFLVFFAFRLLSIILNFDNKFAYPAAVVASLSPSIAILHLDCFFSNVMVLPFLMIWPIMSADGEGKISAFRVIVSGLHLAVVAAIYTEMFLPLLLCSFIVFVFISLRAWSVLGLVFAFNNFVFRKVIFGMVVLAVALLSNIGFVDGIKNITHRTISPGILDFIFPWAFDLEGFVRLWTGDQVLDIANSWQTVILFNTLTISVVVLSFICIFRLYLLSSRLQSFCAMENILKVALMMSFPLAPLFMSIVGERGFPYQFYKLLLTVWPMILFFAAYSFILFASGKRASKYVLTFQLMFIFLNGSLTADSAIASTDPATVAKSGRGGAHLLIDNNFVLLRSRLKSLNGENLYLWWWDNALYNGLWRGRWISYYARNNNLWSAQPTPPAGDGHSQWAQLPHYNGKSIIGISWKEIDHPRRQIIGSLASGTDPFYIYYLDSEKEIIELDMASRKILTRMMKLTVTQDTDAVTWYPIWVSGVQGAATLISVRFDDGNLIFRYDQWGYPPEPIALGGACHGTQILLKLTIDELQSKFSVDCNGENSIMNIVPVATHLKLHDTLGINNVVDKLEGKYPLAEAFPGTIVE